MNKFKGGAGAVGLGFGRRGGKIKIERGPMHEQNAKAGAGSADLAGREREVWATFPPNPKKKTFKTF